MSTLAPALMAPVRWGGVTSLHVGRVDQELRDLPAMRDKKHGRRGDCLSFLPSSSIPTLAHGYGTSLSGFAYYLLACTLITLCVVWPVSRVGKLSGEANAIAARDPCISLVNVSRCRDDCADSLVNGGGGRGTLPARRTVTDGR